MIVSSYSTGDADGDAGDQDSVGRLVGANVGTTESSYGFGDALNVDIPGEDRSINASDASTVPNAVDLTQENSGGMGTDWSRRAWDFTGGLNPGIRWVTSYNASSMVHTCDEDLIPAAQGCFTFIPGQPRFQSRTP